VTWNQVKGYLEKMLSSHEAQKRAICLGLITVGVVLILLSFAHISEANSASPASQPIAALEPETPCDVCHEETTQAEQTTIRMALQTVSAGALNLQRQSFSASNDKTLEEIEQLLADARQLLQNGETNAARALVDHAAELVNQLEQQARLREQGTFNPFMTVGVLSQKTAFDLSLNRHIIAVAYTADQSLQREESDRVLSSHVEDMHRRAPPSDEESAFTITNNLMFQLTKIATFEVRNLFCCLSIRKYTGVDRAPRYFVWA
jgi:hypothetical protein